MGSLKRFVSTFLSFYAIGFPIYVLVDLVPFPSGFAAGVAGVAKCAVLLFFCFGAFFIKGMETGDEIVLRLVEFNVVSAMLSAGCYLIIKKALRK